MDTAGAYPGFCNVKLPSITSITTGVYLYSWVERGTVRVKCLAQEHNTMTPASARTQTVRSEVQRADHKATGRLETC